VPCTVRLKGIEVLLIEHVSVYFMPVALRWPENRYSPNPLPSSRLRRIAGRYSLGPPPMQDRTFESYPRDPIDRALGVRLNKLTIGEIKEQSSYASKIHTLGRFTDRQQGRTTG
jgi:hypothetical protein